MEVINSRSQDNMDTKADVEKHYCRIEKLNITLYLMSKSISLLGTNVYNFALSLYILKATGSGTSFAMNVLIGLLPRVILGPFAGVLADRVNRKKLSITLDIINGLFVFGLFAISSAYGLKIGLIYAVNLLLSISGVFYDTSLGASLPNLVRDKSLMKINSYSSVSSSLSGVLSPIIAGLIYGLVPINLFLIVNSLSFIISSLLELLMNFNLNKVSESSKTPASYKAIVIDLKEVLSFVKNQKILSELFKYALIINLFFNAALSVVYPYVINKVLKMKPSQFGTLEAIFSIGILLASIVLGNRKEKSNKFKSIEIGLGLIGLLIILIGIPTLNINIFSSKSFLFIYNALLAITLGIVMVFVNTPLMVLIQRLTPDNLMGRVMGILGTLTNGIAPIGIVAAGLVIDRVHPFLLLGSTGVVIIILSFVMIGNKALSEF